MHTYMNRYIYIYIYTYSLNSHYPSQLACLLVGICWLHRDEEYKSLLVGQHLLVYLWKFIELH